MSSAPADNTRIEPRRLRVQMLRIVDQKHLDARAFGRQQIVVRRQGFQRRADQFGGAQCGHGGLRGRHSDRGTQQHDLLVGLGELARGQPLGSVGAPSDALQLNRIHPAFGAARQQIAQLGGESDGAQRGPQLRGPRHGGPVTVFEVPGEKFADDAVLLGAGDQSRRRVTLALRRQTQDRERIRMHGADQRFANDRAVAGFAAEPR